MINRHLLIIVIIPPEEGDDLPPGARVRPLEGKGLLPGPPDQPPVIGPEGGGILRRGRVQIGIGILDGGGGTARHAPEHPHQVPPVQGGVRVPRPGQEPLLLRPGQGGGRRIAGDRRGPGRPPQEEKGLPQGTGGGGEEGLRPAAVGDPRLVRPPEGLGKVVLGQGQGGLPEPVEVGGPVLPEGDVPLFGGDRGRASRHQAASQRVKVSAPPAFKWRAS